MDAPRQAPKAAPKKVRTPKEPQDEIMRHTVQAKTPGLDKPHPPSPDAHTVTVPSMLTADDMAFTGK